MLVSVNVFALLTVMNFILYSFNTCHLVGSVISSALDPAMVNIRIRNKGAKGNLNAPKEASATVALISALTQVDAPTLGQDWKQTLEDPNCKSYANLRARLNDLEEKIDERNKVRDTNVDYHPRFCTLSVSS